MTKYLKTRKNRIIVKFILGIIIVSLIFSTMNSYINQDLEKYIAIINGEKISFKVFQNMYFIEQEKQKKLLGKNFFKLKNNEKFIEETYNYVLSQLINNVLLEQYTKKIKLKINDNEITETILSSPLFQKNGKFNKEKYFNYLSSIHLSNHEYIDIIKKKINTENLIHTIANSNFILKNEKENIVKLLSQKRMIKKSIIKVDSMFDKQDVTEVEAQNYFYKHKNHFYIPEKFKISFVQLKPEKFKIKCSNKEINEWYLKHIEKYTIKEKRKYSIIQIKTENEALLILSELYKKPENFSKIAQEKSIDPISSKKGGDIGWIPIDLIPNEIKSANLNKKNQISNIIPFHNEFLIVKLNEVVVKKPKNLYEIYNLIEEEVKNKKSLDLYHKLQNKISDTIKKIPNQFDLILKRNNLSAQETDWFDKNSIPNILNIPILKKNIFNEKLFNQEKKLQSRSNFIIVDKNQSFLINIKDFQNKKLQNFLDVRLNIIKKIKFIKAIKETKRKSQKIICELQRGNKKLFNKYHLYFSSSENISRYSNDPLTSIVFSLPRPQKGKETYTLYQDKNKNFMIIALQEIYNKKFAQEEKNIIVEYLEKNNTETMFNSLLKNLRETSTIKY